MIAALATLTPELYVTDLGRSLDFYVRQLGFTLLYQRPEEGYAFLTLGGAQLMLEQAAPAGSVTGDESKQVPRREAEFAYPPGRAITLQIEVEDVGVYVERLRRTGYPLALEPHEKWFRTDGELSGSRRLLVTDPDRHPIRLAEYLGTRLLEP